MNIRMLQVCWRDNVQADAAVWKDPDNGNKQTALGTQDLFQVLISLLI